MENDRLIGRSRIIISVLAISLLFFLGVYLMVGAPGFDLTSQAHQIIQIIGSFIAVSITTQLIYVILIRPIDDHKLEIKLTSLFEKKLDSMFTQSIHFGFKGFEDPLDFGKLFDGLDSTNTLWWLDTYDPHYRTWSESLIQALKRGAAVNVLVMDPKSTLVDMRANELGREFMDGIFQAELASFIKHLNNIKNENEFGQNLTIRTYSDLPAAPIYIIDKGGESFCAYTSYFLGKATGVGFPHLCWTRQVGGGFLAELTNYMQQKWKNSRGDRI